MIATVHATVAIQAVLFRKTFFYNTGRALLHSETRYHAPHGAIMGACVLQVKQKNMKRTTERRYTDMLEVLPPAATKFIDGGLAAFLVGEPATHKNGVEAYACYVKNGEHYAIDEPQTIAEFHALDISTLPYNEAEDAEEDAEELAARDEHGDAIVDAAIACDVMLENIAEAYAGEYDSDEDFAQSMADELGMLNKEMSWPYSCIDWTAAARDLMYDYCEDGGHYFRNL